MAVRVGWARIAVAAALLVGSAPVGFGRIEIAWAGADTTYGTQTSRDDRKDILGAAGVHVVWGDHRDGTIAIHHGRIDLRDQMSTTTARFLQNERCRVMEIELRRAGADLP